MYTNKYINKLFLHISINYFFNKNIMITQLNSVYLIQYYNVQKQTNTIVGIFIKQKTDKCYNPLYHITLPVLLINHFYLNISQKTISINVIICLLVVLSNKNMTKVVVCVCTVEYQFF